MLDEEFPLILDPFGATETVQYRNRLIILFHVQLTTRSSGIGKSTGYQAAWYDIGHGKIFGHCFCLANCVSWEFRWDVHFQIGS